MDSWLRVSNLYSQLYNFKSNNGYATRLTTFLGVPPVLLPKSEPFPLLPLPQQKQIVAILDKAFAAIETAKANGLAPYDYLNYLLSEIPTLQQEQSIEHLLPWEFAKR